MILKGIYSRISKQRYIVLLALICLANWSLGAVRATDKLTAKDIVQAADKVRFPEEAFQVDLEMVTTKSDGKKLVRRMKVLSHGADKVLVEFHYPAREKGRAL